MPNYPIIYFTQPRHDLYSILYLNLILILEFCNPVHDHDLNLQLDPFVSLIASLIPNLILNLTLNPILNPAVESTPGCLYSCAVRTSLSPGPYLLIGGIHAHTRFPVDRCVCIHSPATYVALALRACGRSARRAACHCTLSLVVSCGQ